MMKKFQILFVVIALSIYFLVLIFQSAEYKIKQIDNTSSKNFQRTLNINSNDTDICKIPKYSPFNSEARKFYKKMPDITYNLLYIDNEGNLSFNNINWKKLNVTPGSSSVTCEYSEIYRRKYSGTIIEFEMQPFVKMYSKVKPSSDFLFAKCSNYAGSVIYADYFAFTQRNPGPRNYKNDQEVGLIIIGLDSMSRLNFLRQFPRTYRFMRNYLLTVEMKGVNKVGVNTFPNVMAMLTGLPVPPPPHNFKNMQFLWDGFQERGAATMYAEDMPQINMFNLHGDGLLRKPTHHYAYTFWQAVEYSLTQHYSSKYCLGSKTKFSIHLNYIKSFLQTYKDCPKFLFSLHNELTHDTLNLASNADDELKDFLKTSYDAGLLDRSIVVLLGDHGHRIDSYRMTEMGRMEDLMPFTFFILPRNYRNTDWYKTLTVNSNRLVSTYDLYKTFENIMFTLEKNVSTYEGSSFRKSSSLFYPVSARRSCYSAGIPEQYCICSNSYEMMSAFETSNPLSMHAVKYALLEMNLQIKQATDLCAELFIDSIIKSTHIFNKARFRLLVLFSTKPSRGIFEATVDFSTDDVQLVGDVLRINRYHGESDCLPHDLQIIEFFKTTCYCMTGRGTNVVN
ncbi:uncharacterized protein LOC106666665 isoform X2 [Cimex lectularius]|uniref:Uncharacterized protein n=1 Tax=Cimex lectularius TaxID=79782 RepID=A0A8I6RQC9_CIMLE|nr:uncharacterized protein LOC106666665 isoform X2 [Cimex lectularius]